MPDRPDYDKLTDPEINRLCAERFGLRCTVPDFCHDRNAWPEFWATMTDEAHIRRYMGTLDTMVSAVEEDTRLAVFKIITATPRQHAVAFLKATEPGT